MKRFSLAVSAAVFTAMLGCTTVPETGRRQLMIISPQEETQMGLAAFQDVKTKEQISNNPKYNAQVQRVGQRIAASVGRELPNAQWEFVVFESDQINAFALPGGKVSVYTGLLKIVQSDDELAIVMGHEIAHVTSRHGAERTSQQLIAAGGTALAAAYLETRHEMDPTKRNLIVAGLGAGATYGVLMPYSRLQESEADSIGLRFAAGAGYDPRAAVTFWKRMSAATGKQGKPPVFLSDHPSDESRIANLEQLVPQYMPVYEAAKQRYERGGPGALANPNTEIGR